MPQPPAASPRERQHQSPGQLLSSRPLAQRRSVPTSQPGPLHQHSLTAWKLPASLAASHCWPIPETSGMASSDPVTNLTSQTAD